MLAGRCARLLRRPAALPHRPPAPGASRRLAAAAAAAADIAEPRPSPAAPAATAPPPMALMLCGSGRLLHTSALTSPLTGAAPCRRQPLCRLLCCGPAAAAAAGPFSRPAHELGAVCSPVELRRVLGDLRPRGMKSEVRRTGREMRATVRRIVSHENVYTVPNALCVARIALTPAIGWLVTTGAYGPALAAFLVAGVTDLLDGWIARTFPGQSSVLGSFLDPLADKLLVATLFVSLTYAGLIPVVLTALIVGRDLGLIAAAAWVRHRSVPPPVTLSRYFDPTLATAQLEPTLISKVNTCLQLALVASTLAAPVFGYVDHTALRVLWCVTAGTTVTSGLVYALLQGSTYRLLERGDGQRPS